MGAVTPYVRFSPTKNDRRIFRQFEEYGTQIIIILVNRESECSILSEAQRMQITWPNYALVLFDFQPDYQRHSNSCYFENVIVLKNSLYDNNRDKHENLSCNIIKDSIAAVTSAQTHSPTTVNFRDNKRLINISITQVGNGDNDDSLIAWYDSDLEVLSTNFAMLPTGRLPRGGTLYTDNTSSALHITVVVMLFGLCFAFITMNLILYICFRNEPEVKATSVTVSMCMFVGCYMLILYVPVLLVDLQPINHTRSSGLLICYLNVICSLAGIPFCLIISTLFVKMLRVYLIFYKSPSSYKKNFFSNPILFVYILILVSPTVLIFLLWGTLDTFEKHKLFFPMKNHTFVFDACTSNYLEIWISALVIYLFILITALAVLAFKTLEIRYKNFRDTKATNAFAFLIIFIHAITLLYWGFLPSIPVTVTRIRNSEINLYIGHITETVLCQCILFVPKVYPPFKRWIYQNKVN